jgi:hypothetical protein
VLDAADVARKPDDIVAGLDAGADDYLVKPQTPASCARINARRVLTLQERLADQRRRTAGRWPASAPARPVADLHLLQAYPRRRSCWTQVESQNPPTDRRAVQPRHLPAGAQLDQEIDEYQRKKQAEVRKH